MKANFFFLLHLTVKCKEQKHLFTSYFFCLQYWEHYESPFEKKIKVYIFQMIIKATLLQFTEIKSETENDIYKNVFI